MYVSATELPSTMLNQLLESVVYPLSGYKELLSAQPRNGQTCDRRRCRRNQRDHVAGGEAYVASSQRVASSRDPPEKKWYCKFSSALSGVPPLGEKIAQDLFGTGRIFYANNL